jgi:hypothetical protein
MITIVSERERDMMNFVEYEVTAIDIKTAWMATNTDIEVDIIKNIKDEFELWLGKDFFKMFKTFEEARKNAEARVDFTMTY